MRPTEDQSPTFERRRLLAAGAAASSRSGATEQDDAVLATAIPSIVLHTGPRADLRHLFELAEDSRSELDAYIELGDLLVAALDGKPVGHVQLVDGPQNDVIEIKNMAVVPAHERQGIGTALVHAALERSFAAGARRVLVATAAADTGNLHFYQRCGFRFLRVERDAFTAQTGYPDLEIDGIALRDRVWLDREL